jgi:hypothetical protein
MQGFTSNYLRVEKAYDAGAVNQLEKVSLGKLDSETIFRV